MSQRGRKRARFNGSRVSPADAHKIETRRVESPNLRRNDAPSSSSRSPNEASAHCDSPLPPSPQATEEDISNASDSSDTAAINFVRAISLSSIIHPTHESCLTPPPSISDGSPSSGFFINLAGAQDLIMQACQALNLSIRTLQSLIDAYFENMTSFSLFHQPSFGTKIQEIKNLLHLKALFASMFSFSARFATDRYQGTYTHEPQENLMHERFHVIALQCIREARDECGDGIPPLCVLQAMALSTFYQLTIGVRGRAWRLLGSCVRVAYELRLHLIDYEGQGPSSKAGIDLARWSANEERRRCWWAIWEMDVFASTIRRCPTAIDWSINDTYLPVTDEYWYNSRYHSSCFLEKKPMDRWKRLQKCNNESASAWFIVLNSIMRDAQVLSRGNMQGILPDSDPNNNVAQLTHYFRNNFRKKRSEEDSTKLTLLIHALRCTTSVLPDSLAYNGESLSFSTSPFVRANDQSDHDTKLLHSAKYGIYLMTQLARFMIYHHYAFGEISSGTIFADKPSSPTFGWTAAEQQHPTNCEGLRNCLEAADNISAVTHRCADNHVRFVNPFLASTVWLATSLQILKKVVAPENHTELNASKSEVLKLSCHQYVQFWGTPLALLENLDTLEERLITRKNVSSHMEKSQEGKKAQVFRPVSKPHINGSGCAEPQRMSVDWRNNASRQGSTGGLDIDGMPLYQSPQTVHSEFNPASLGLVGRPPNAGKAPSQTSIDQGHDQIAPGGVIGHDLRPHEQQNIDHMSYLDADTFMALDSQIGVSEDLGDRFAWFLATDMMSDSLTR
ncbi:uncharacterized protein BDZ99DRAFT_198166 [Mytilinidion resinicola]|uniref:Xylanolytic transcriptional activator regulatory domain-containing protein n=1 Tax=Mytilinidion resinicola TaxID=574789 RepID=A0A6A6Z2Z7_9PEZI|nr:uncharacterized protein BDZ99DRAFT_198166 [Mytilinidion resinicola]KAF2815542.1 hypothetical protein BDZ99DRAFT_198166 [Mytilinidion resinicola]